MTALAGTVTIGRLILRRDRLRSAVWALSLGGLAVVTATSILDLYPTRAALAEYAATVAGNQAVVAMSGPARGLDTPGGRIAFELWQVSVAMGLLGVFAVTRHTRGEEESGRSELLRSAPLGRHATSIAAVATAAVTCTVVGAAVALGLIAAGLAVGGSVLMGASFAVTGTVFATMTLVVAQVTAHARAAAGAASALVGAADVVRAVADARGDGLSWASPLGWMQATQPFTGDRWWPLGLSVVAIVALTGVALVVEGRRDHGAGLTRPRPGPARAAGWLVGPVALAWRLQRAAVVGWIVGLFVAGVAFGSVVSSADDLIGDNDAMTAYLASVGGASLADLFLATLLLYLALAAAGFAVAAVLRARSEEVAGRVEPLLAAGTSRVGWAGGHVLVAALGSVVLLVAGGAGLGLSYGLTIDDLGQVPRTAVAGLAFVPAVWVFGAVAAALVGWRPSWSGAAWAVLAVSVAIAMFGTAADLPQGALDVSPFTAVPAVPAAGVEPVPLVVLTLIAVALTGAGAVGIRRRDVGH